MWFNQEKKKLECIGAFETKTDRSATSFLVGLRAYATQAENSMHNHRTDFI